MVGVGVATRWALPVVVASVVCGWWVTGLEPFSSHATVAVLVVGLLSMTVGRARRPPRPVVDAPGGRTAVIWVALVGLLLTWQVAAYLQHPRSDHPTLSSLTNAALDPRPVRALAFAGWMLAAGWLARR